MPRIMKIFGRKHGNDTASTDSQLDLAPGFDPSGGTRISSPLDSPALSDKDLFGDGDTDDDEPGLLRRTTRVSAPPADRPVPHAGIAEAPPAPPIEAAASTPIETPAPPEAPTWAPSELQQRSDNAAPDSLGAAAAPAPVEASALAPIETASTAGSVSITEGAPALFTEPAAAAPDSDKAAEAPEPAPARRIEAPPASAPGMQAKSPVSVRLPPPLRNEEAGLYRTPFTTPTPPGLSAKITINPTGTPAQASVEPAPPPTAYHEPSEGSAPVDPASLTASKTLIGGREADIVPLIPDTRVEVESQELDDEAVATATVEALRGACDVLVARVNRIVALSDGGQIIAGLIDVVSELDIRYADDWGVVRKNGIRDVLDQVYDMVPEGDRFILESLDNGRGKLSADEFVHDLRTVAESDRPRIVSEYASFLAFVIRCVLRQYLRPLEHDQLRLRDVSRRVDYLIDGVRDVLVNRINAGFRAG